MAKVGAKPIRHHSLRIRREWYRADLLGRILIQADIVFAGSRMRAENHENIWRETASQAVIDTT